MRVLFHFPGTVDAFERRAALLMTKIGFFPRGPASLSPPSPAFVPPTRDVAASKGRKNNGRDKEKKDVANNHRLNHGQKLTKRPFRKTQRNVARDKTFLAVIIYRLEGGIFTPRVTGTITGPSNCNLSDSEGCASFHFPGAVDPFKRRVALLITKIGFFPHGPAALSPPSPTFVSPIKGLAASEGRKNSGRDKKRKKKKRVKYN
ncbi:hypothetical protein CDAR_551561 [Caerostris darwini]|uniref:Ribosomal protein S11 n=1 Tax=Caerostris darwini TaxID=1538125 RepID=A0AAV4V5Q6_9ARAC|nr:hypothetical protein CDAR_551561 [Caerostris darwini]